ncbi:hypothetical protein Nepgr_009937 [Nepenthes gracilis]|uniref:C2H2-type domain-containing protein n=1 Tax=Nepenthes gracilis TaxID=150966 RepID=A0AAD3XKL5_NEPGR|nr:hypothetical protein Nepgr_009937 [Nepenthes gracilis]
MGNDGKGDTGGTIFRDIRRYYCQYCGICRSKRCLITSHILSHHQEEMKEQEIDGFEEKEGLKPNVCQDCGASFNKPAYLRQHMQSHSLERPFVCPVDGCKTSYRRKDHLNRHLLVHQGKFFKCPFENCNLKFSIQGNMKRHLKEIHDRKPHVSEIDGQKKFICQEMGCGKEFTFKSKLRKHEDSHVKLESVEAFCADPCCMKPFTNMKCLKAHIQACHLHVICEVCGSRQLRKNIKRHLCSHQGCSLERIKCSFKDCNHTFTNKSNLQQHINSVHLELRPFVCGVPGCGMRFPFKHVRDKHEKSTSHVYVHGDLEEFDEHLRSGPRVGEKGSARMLKCLPEKGSPHQANQAMLGMTALVTYLGCFLLMMIAFHELDPHQPSTPVI